MGKQLIIPGADFSANAIVIPLTITVKAGGSVTIGGVEYAALANKDAMYEIDSVPSGFYLNYEEDIKYIRIGTAISLPSMGGAFRDNGNLEEVVFAADVTTSDVANIMFANCSKLKKFNGKHLYYVAGNASMLFYACAALEEVVNLDNFTDELSNTSSMFSGCSQLTTLDISNFSTANVEDMSYMFKNCSKLQVLTLGEGFSLEGNPTITGMFQNCTVLKTINAPSLVASDYNVSGTDTYRFIQGIDSSTSHDLTIVCGTGSLHWDGSAWSVV